MNKIFVVGCPRSGTTLIQQLLGSREDIYTCRETHFFQNIRRKGWRKVFDHLWLSSDSVVRAYEFIQSNNQLLTQHDPSGIRTFPSAANFFDRLMTSEADARAMNAWVEKTPGHLRYVKLIQRHIPTARFVHVLRDGRDVVASMVDAAQRFPDADAWKSHRDLKTAVKIHNHFLEESLKYYGMNSHIFVQYEHVLTSAEVVREKLYSTLDLTGNGRFLDLGDLHSKIVRQDESWKADFRGDIVDTRLKKFNQIFTQDEKQFIADRIKHWPSDSAVL